MGATPPQDTDEVATLVDGDKPCHAHGEKNIVDLCNRGQEYFCQGVVEPPPDDATTLLIISRTNALEATHKACRNAPPYQMTYQSVNVL